MSDSDESGVTYTEVSSPFEGLSDIGSPRAAQSPDYVPASPDPEADLEEVCDEGSRGDPVTILCMEDADGDEEEEEHLAPADSVVVALPATDQAPSAEETELFETDEGCQTSRYIYITIITTLPMVFTTSPDTSRHTTLSPPSLCLSPAHLPSHIVHGDIELLMIRMRAKAELLSHSLPLSLPFILSPTRPDAPLLGIPPPLPISVPTSSPPLLLPSASRREDIPEVTLPPRKRLGIALGPGYEVGESSSAAAARPAGGLRADYGFVATMDREIRRDPERERLDMDHRS
ncbi:hypothetical protein Tco_0748661 [Tanacetum coccineum]|uniref:Uncharacterized protein n=1 Tax=Tanacetum coccineum TaxID=301880 RepID=A0ABQ4YZ12_9ASTR